MHLKFSKDFFHFTALHENHRLRFAACFPLISQCWRIGLGAIPQAQRLNLGKFRGSRSGGLNKVLRTKIDLSPHEVSFKVSTRDLWSNREVRNRKKAIVYRCTIGAYVCKTSAKVFQLFFIVENDAGGFALLSYKWCEIILCPNGLLLLDFLFLLYQDKR